MLEFLIILYTFVSLPAMAVAGAAYFYKIRTNGGMLFGGGAFIAAIGSMYNKLIPWQNFIANAQHGLPNWLHSTMSLAFLIHIIGLNIMVIGILMITFGKQKE